MNKNYSDKKIFNRRVKHVAGLFRVKDDNAVSSYLDEFKGSYAAKLAIGAVTKIIKKENL